jgi:hypothetical protein
LVLQTSQRQRGPRWQQSSMQSILALTLISSFAHGLSLRLQ